MSGRRRSREEPGASAVFASSPWVVVCIGVVVMVVLMIVAVGGPDGRSSGLTPGVPEQTVPLPALPPPASPTRDVPVELTAGPGLSPRWKATPSPAAPSTRAPGGAAGTGAPTRPPAPPALTGRYAVRDTFDNGFIGEVLVTNVSSASRGWTVRMEMPRGRLVTAWIEGAPQGRISRSGDSYVFTSGVDLAVGASVPLRFHFEDTGTVTRPARCTVDGAACTGL